MNDLQVNQRITNEQNRGEVGRGWGQNTKDRKGAKFVKQMGQAWGKGGKKKAEIKKKPKKTMSLRLTGGGKETALCTTRSERTNKGGGVFFVGRRHLLGSGVGCWGFLLGWVFTVVGKKKEGTGGGTFLHNPRGQQTHWREKHKKTKNKDNRGSSDGWTTGTCDWVGQGSTLKEERKTGGKIKQKKENKHHDQKQQTMLGGTTGNGGECWSGEKNLRIRRTNS